MAIQVNSIIIQVAGWKIYVFDYEILKLPFWTLTHWLLGDLEEFLDK